MSNGIYLIGRGTVNEGRIKTAKAALASVVKTVRESNPGVQLYEHAVDADTGAWVGIEKYANDEALRAHLTNPAVGEALGRFMADLAFDGIVVMGDVSDGVREMMAGFHPSYVGASMGFARSTEPPIRERVS